MTLDPDLLAKALARMAGGVELPLSNLIRLSGGANMESSSFDWGGAGYVLRRAPSAEMMEGRPFGHDVEAALVRAARAGGVLAPEIVGELADGDGLGTGYVMKRVEAEVNPAKILAAPPPSLIADIARELSRIHQINAPVAIPPMDTAAALANLKARFMDYGGDRPIIALAIKWCEDHLPDPAPPVLVHGDFRMGNLMVRADGLAAVLDWELAHIGDAHEDLAWGCVGAWQFGHVEKPAFGCASIEALFAAYEVESGIAVDPARFRFWLIYRTLWWALGCLQMGEIWRSGVDRSLERAVIGRRTSENEIDLLMLLEADAPVGERHHRSPAQAGVQTKQENAASRHNLPGTGLRPAPENKGEPSQIEMLEALSEWIATDIKPRAEGRDKFMAAVAMNALGMLAREVANPVAVLDKALCDDLLAGRVTLATPGLLAQLRKVALVKLTNDVPKYAGLAKAKAVWEG